MGEELGFLEQMVRENMVYITRIPAALFTLLIAYIVLRILQNGIRTATRLGRIDPRIQGVILSVVGFVGWILALSAALGVMNLSQLSLALGGSVALVAMALATGLNSVAQDLLAGIFLLSDANFKVGARVRAGGVEGIVEELTIRKIRIRGDDGWLHTIPNRNVDSNTYVVMDREEGGPVAKAG